MPTAELEIEASTSNKYPVLTLPQIGCMGYHYFPFQASVQTAAQYGTVFCASENPEDYTCDIDKETDETASNTILCIIQNANLNIAVNSFCKRPNLFGNDYYKIHNLIYSDYLTNSFDIIFPNTVHFTKMFSPIDRIIINLFKSYGHEEFNSDISYYFTTDVEKLLREYGKSAITAIGNIIAKESNKPNLINETLKALGRIEDTDTKSARFDLLAGCLNNASALIRDAAVSGLSFLDDKRALPQLRILYEIETAPILKGNIKVAIENLEL